MLLIMLVIFVLLIVLLVRSNFEGGVVLYYQVLNSVGVSGRGTRGGAKFPGVFMSFGGL